MNTPALPDYQPDEARARTDQVKHAFDKLYAILLELHDREAHRALGYDTWAGYVEAEFGMAPSRSYQLLTQGRVVAEIESAMSTNVEISEAAVRDIKDDVDEVIRRAKDLVHQGSAPGAAIEAVVVEVRRQERKRKQQRRDEQRRLDAEREARLREARAPQPGPVSSVEPSPDTPTFETVMDDTISGEPVEQLASTNTIDLPDGGTLDMPDLRVPRRAFLDTPVEQPEPAALEPSKQPSRIDLAGLVNRLGVSREVRTMTKTLPHQDALRVALHVLSKGLTEVEVKMLLNQAKRQQPEAAKQWARNVAMGG